MTLPRLFLTGYTYLAHIITRENFLQLNTNAQDQATSTNMIRNPFSYYDCKDGVKKNLKEHF